MEYSSKRFLMASGSEAQPSDDAWAKKDSADYLVGSSRKPSDFLLSELINEFTLAEDLGLVVASADEDPESKTFSRGLTIPLGCQYDLAPCSSLAFDCGTYGVSPLDLAQIMSYPGNRPRIQSCDSVVGSVVPDYTREVIGQIWTTWASCKDKDKDNARNKDKNSETAHFFDKAHDSFSRQNDPESPCGCVCDSNLFPSRTKIWTDELINPNKKSSWLSTVSTSVGSPTSGTDISFGDQQSDACLNRHVGLDSPVSSVNCKFSPDTSALGAMNHRQTDELILSGESISCTQKISTLPKGSSNGLLKVLDNHIESIQRNRIKCACELPSRRSRAGTCDDSFLVGSIGDSPEGMYPDLKSRRTRNGSCSRQTRLVSSRHGWNREVLNNTTEANVRFRTPKVTNMDVGHHKTTIMLRNIPNKYSQKMVLDAINQNFEGLYDFFYLPIDFRNKCNVGYAFINFLSPYYAESFKQKFVGVKLNAFKSRKICEVSWGRVQGLQANIEHYRNSAVMSIPNELYRPLLMRNGICLPFPAPNAAVPSVKLRPQKQM